jgi:hypothetical protein
VGSINRVTFVVRRSRFVATDEGFGSRLRVERTAAWRAALKASGERSRMM